jgi:20S proteasome subunit alpha 3
LIDL